MSCSDEYQKREQILDAFGAKSSPQRLPGSLGLRRLDKDQRGSGKDQVFNLAVRGGPIAGPFDGRKAIINRFERPPPRRMVWGCTADEPDSHVIGELGAVDPDELFASGRAWGIHVELEMQA